MTYVYPVVSRRAGGVSVGVNLNPNQACNWRCVYCQVPDLARGAGPPVDLDLLRGELSTLVDNVSTGEWLQANVPEGHRRLSDVALSGDGEPTTSPDFADAISVVGEVLEKRGLTGTLPVILITNGSQGSKPGVQEGLLRMASLSGQVWFKLDAGTEAGRLAMNDAPSPQQKVEDDLVRAAELCTVRLQVMRLAVDGAGPTPQEDDAWIALVRRAQARGARLADVLLYGLERPSLQPEAPRLGKLPSEELHAFAARVEADLGLHVKVSP